MPQSARLSLALVIAMLGAVAAHAEDGQKYLDKATDAKLSAESLADLGEVIDLCEQSLKAGLDDGNKLFATKLLAGTLFQRAETLCAEIFDRPTPSRNWPRLRVSALADLQRALKSDPSLAQAQYLMARLQMLPGGDRPAARQALDEAIRLSTGDPPLKAKSLLLRAGLREKMAERQADFDQAVKLAPRDSDVLRARGLFYLLQNKYDLAAADLDASLALAPNHAETYEARGLAALFSNKNDEALQNFNKAVELDPDSPVAYSHRARVHALKGHSSEALADLDKALQIAPRAVSILLLRARVYQQAKQGDKALADVEEALRLQPGQLEALQLHAALAAGAGNFNRAIEDLQELIKTEPENSDLLMQLAIFYSADKQAQKALKTFDALLAKNAKNWNAYRGRADLYLGLGQQAEAITDYEAALKLEPKNSGILNNLAWVLATSPNEKLRDGKRAIELATTACQLTDYKQAHILSTLAAGYAEIGDFQHAVDWSKKAVELGDEELKPQLGKELASYEQRKPWRELQSPESEKSADKSKSNGAADPSGGKSARAPRDNSPVPDDDPLQEDPDDANGSGKPQGFSDTESPPPK